MRTFALACAVLLAAACRKAPPPSKNESSVPPRAVVAGVTLVDYDAATGEFSCRAPGDWRTLEDMSQGPRVMFFGPGSAKHPLSVAISIARYPGAGAIRTPEDYRDALKLSGQSPSPLVRREVEGRPAYALRYDLPQRPLHGGKDSYMKREDVVLIPVPGGFFALAHSAPVETASATLPVFEAVVASFRPKA